MEEDFPEIIYKNNRVIRSHRGWHIVGTQLYTVTDTNIIEWVENQPTDKWQLFESNVYGEKVIPMFKIYNFDEDMETWFLLRWS